MAFKKATKQQARLRLALSGPPGAGKTFTALVLAKHLGARVAVIDTERGSASKYAGDVAEFDTNELEIFSPQAYMTAMTDAAKAGYDVLVIDSLSHAWSGRGGILEEVDRRGGKFDAWRHASPLHQKLVDAILSYPGHVIATMRSKTDYQVTSIERNGKKETKVEKLGLAPVQRDDLPYEFDMWLDMNERNVANVSKSRCSGIRPGEAIECPGQDLADRLKAWLSDGAPMAERPPRQGDDRPLDRGRSQTTNTTQGTARTPATNTSDGGSTRKPETDEYGLTPPSFPCPVFTNDGPNKGKRWDQVPPALIEKMLAEYGQRMSERQVEWGTYIAARRQARKAAEARAAEQAARAAEQAAAAAEEPSFPDPEAGDASEPAVDEPANTEAA